MKCPQCGEQLAVDPQTGLKYCADCPYKEIRKNPVKDLKNDLGLEGIPDAKLAELIEGGVKNDC